MVGAEQFFTYYDTLDTQRLTIAAVNMEGLVVPWFQMMRKSNQVPSWAALSKAIELQFGPSQFECPRAKLFKLSQLSSVTEYYKEFMILANRVEGLTEDALLDCFISGLKQDIKRDVIAQSPSSLLRAASLARLFDEKQLTSFSNAKFRSPTFSSSPSPISVVPPNPPWRTSTSAPSSPAVSKPLLPPLLPTSAFKPFPTVKRKTPSEMHIRREKGLCYTCDDKFLWNHKCPNRQYLLLQTEEEDNSVDVIEDEQPTVDPLPSHQLSFNALKGTDVVDTIRFKGMIKGHEVQILLNGGCSDNFIQPASSSFRWNRCLTLKLWWGMDTT